MARRRQSAARELRRRAEGSAVVFGADELIERLAAGDDEHTPRFAGAVLNAHGLVAEPALHRARPGEPITVRRQPGLAIEGAVATTAVFAALGVVAFWVYGLLFGITGAVAVIALKTRAEHVERYVPDAVPRGRWLGALLAGAAILVVLVAVALPIRYVRRGGF